MPGGRSLVERLRDDGAFPHPVKRPMQVVETHISWVLLTGEIAYKIKKPLALAFLDYSTLQRRRHCCEEELRLNSRCAPGLYLGVSTIGVDGEVRVDGPGPPVEVAVRMRQFDVREELDALLERRAVEPAELATLGERIAEFHRNASPADPGSGHGSAATVRRVMLDNFAEIRRLPEASDWRSELDALEGREAGALDALGALIEARRAQGQVRECHGDLHCGNVVRWSGALTPFDGIEFDPALRFVDVANDLAFLTMDLDERGRPDLRNVVLRSWLESLGDFEALRLLPTFEVYRALVRAKVASLRAAQETDAAARARDVGTARRYLDWAHARRKRPAARLLLTCGLSGAGKTWLARALAAAMPALHLRSDVERKRLAGLGPLEDSRSPPDGGIYTPEFTRRTYDRLAECAGHALRGGESIIVDAAFLRREERARMRALARDQGASFAILHCVAPPAVLRERVGGRAARGDDASEAGLSLLDRQPAYWEDFDADERADVLEVDTTATDAVARCLDRLDALPARRA